MQVSDFVLLMICCLAWAGNLVLSAWALGNNPVPPFLLAFARSSIVLLFMFPFFRLPLPKRWGRLLLVCACIGPIHLGFLYIGLQTASATGGSIVSQMFIPIATLLSIIFLKERVGWRRGLAIVGAFIGTIIMIYDSRDMALDIGLIYVMMAYVAMAVGSIVMKAVGDVDWRQYVLWMASMVFVTMGLASFFFETGQAEVWRDSRVPLLITAGYAAIAVTILAHGQYFNLIKKYDVSVVVPLTLVVPLFASVMGVLFLGEVIYQRYYIGAALILPCVYVIAKRQGVSP